MVDDDNVDDDPITATRTGIPSRQGVATEEDVELRGLIETIRSYRTGDDKNAVIDLHGLANELSKHADRRFEELVSEDIVASLSLRLKFRRRLTIARFEN